jgi:hypothetical protein
MVNDLASYSFLIGGLAFLSFIGLAYLKDKFAKVAGKKIVELFENLFGWIIIISIGIFLLAILVMILNEPSAYEKCMESVKKQIDPQAIAWMEEYCATNS